MKKSPNPFAGAKTYGKGKGNYKQDTARRMALTGDTLAGQRSSPRGEQRKVFKGIQMDVGLWEFLEDRAAILGVKVAPMIRDVLSLWAHLIREAEQKAGIDYDVPQQTIPLHDRAEGYLSALLPAGFSTSHLDDTPIGINEL